MDQELTKNIVFIDTETTGLSAKEDRIIEIAGVELTPDYRPLRIFHEFLDPERPVGYSEKIHGLSDEFLCGRKRFEDIALPLQGFLDGRVVIAHNLPFDESFINAEYDRYGLPYKLSESNETIDTLALAKQRFEGRVSLDALIERFELDGSSRAKHHGALIDAQLLARVYLCLQNQRELAFSLDFTWLNDFDIEYQKTCAPFDQHEQPYNAEMYYFEDNNHKFEALIVHAEGADPETDVDLMEALSRKSTCELKSEQCLGEQQIPLESSLNPTSLQALEESDRMIETGHYLRQTVSEALKELKKD